MNIDINALLKTITENIVLWAPKLGYALLALLVGWMAAAFVGGMVTRGFKRANMDESLGKFLGSLAKMAMLAAVSVAALGVLGIETTSFAAILAAAGLAVGMSLQGSLGNLASGVLLLIFRPFEVGDVVEAGGCTGKVDELGVFATTLKTVDNKVIIIPNGKISDSPITNYTREGNRRVDLVFGVDYGDNLKKVREVILDVANAHPKVLSEPAAQAVVVELGDSSVNLASRSWCKTEDYWGVYSDLLEQVKVRFDAEGISIPYPHQVEIKKGA